VPVTFALAWMWLPPLLLLNASYLFSPMFVERYALWCFVPFFMLVALGASELRITSIRRATIGATGVIIAIGLVVLLALGHLHDYWRRPHDTQWREAADTAAAAIVSGEKIAVAPPFAVNVVRYYLRHTPSAQDAIPANDFAAHNADAHNPAAQVLVIGDQWNAQEEVARLLAQYKHPIAGFRGVWVYGRGTRAR
jgi:hypothetical protein